MDFEAVRVVVMAVVGFCSGALATLFGVSSATLAQVLICLMVMDYVGGLAVAFCGYSPKSPDGRLCSAAGLRGLVRKGGIVAIILVARLLDIALGKPVVTDVTIAFFIVNEGLSIVENAALLGLPVPTALRKALTALNEDAIKDRVKKGGKE